MRIVRSVGIPFLAAFVVILLSASPAVADGEVSFVFGGLLGGDLDALASGDIFGSFENARLFGGRAGFYSGAVGVEGSLVTSPTGLAGTLIEGLKLDARTTYIEGSILVGAFGGSVSPFVAGGIGYHMIELNDIPVDVKKFGYTFGGGVRFAIRQMGIRVDLRDHITKLTPDDLGILGEIFAFEDTTLHNWEISGGVGIRF